MPRFQVFVFLIGLIGRMSQIGLAGSLMADEPDRADGQLGRLMSLIGRMSQIGLAGSLMADEPDRPNG